MAWITLDEALNDLTPLAANELLKMGPIVSGREEVSALVASIITKVGKKKTIICIEGYLAVDFMDFINNLKNHLHESKIEYLDVAQAYKSSVEIEELVNHCLTKYPDFGYVFQGELRNFFNPSKLAKIIQKFKHSSASIIICYGIGSGIADLLKYYDRKFYLDITRETLVSRFEKEKLLPLGAKADSLSARSISKRLSYVDYVVLNKHKREILKAINGYIDINCKTIPKYLSDRLYNQLLQSITCLPFRLKPIYKPGVWGGQEIKRIRGVPDSVINCAFSLEVIPQIQAIRIRLGKGEIEIPFYNLTWNQPEKLMGKEIFKRFGCYFPITQNYDDTCQGGSLAIQDHPHGDYIQARFNERMRRDESYYIVRTYSEAKTYHGIRDDADLDELRKKSELAEKEKIPFDHNEYINTWESVPGDLYLIPSGTVHASGANQLVLEIDTDPSMAGTEYTFHIYDYLRPDLDGNFRGIHIEHAFNVLESHRRRSWVEKHLKQAPRLIRKGDDWAEFLLGDHELMYYKIHKFEFKSQIMDDTIDRFHILTLVTGNEVRVKALSHPEVECIVRYTETVIIPANTGKYLITNMSNDLCQMTKALVK